MYTSIKKISIAAWLLGRLVKFSQVSARVKKTQKGPNRLTK
jgi:hypothetical protein